MFIKNLSGMRSLLLIVLIIFSLCRNGYSQPASANDKRIMDTVRAVLYRSGIKQKQIDTLTLIRTERVSDQEKIAVEIETARQEISKCAEQLRADTVNIQFTNVAINADSNALYRDWEQKKDATGTLKELKSDIADRAGAFKIAKKDDLLYRKAIKSQDSLIKLYPNADTVKKPHYKTLFHMAVTTPQGKVNTDAWIYLDKKYKMIGMMGAGK